MIKLPKIFLAAVGAASLGGGTLAQSSEVIPSDQTVRSIVLVHGAFADGSEGRMACNQVLYNLGERAVEHAVLPWCEAHGVAMVAYSPFGHGDFPDPRSPGGRVLEEIAANHGATARQVALRFLVRRPPAFTIPKASSPDHAAETRWPARCI